MEEPTDEQLHVLMEQVGIAAHESSRRAELELKRRMSCQKIMEKALPLIDRTHVYDSSVENQTPLLLFRTIDGSLYKQYVEEVPE